MDRDLKIYVASLADYVAGRLVGRWVDCEGKDSDDLAAEVADMLSAAEQRDPSLGRREEWAIHDSTGFGNLVTEYMPLEKVAELAAAIVEHDGAMVAFLESVGVDEVDSFQDAYLGEYESLEDYARELIDDCGMLSEMPESLRGYFDFEAYARDLSYDGYWTAPSDACCYVYVFSSY